MSKVLERDNLKVVDLLKIDIEGSEKYILTRENEKLFIERVKYVMLEAHDLNGNKKEDALEYFKRIGFEFEYSRVPWFFGIYRLICRNPFLLKK